MSSNEAERDVIETSQEGAVLTIRLNRPRRLNALNEALVVALAEALRNVPKDVRVVVLTGAGRAFSSGHDLKDAADSPPSTAATARRGAEDLQQVTRAMRECPVPIIGAVRGYAIGAGAEIAFGCDLVVATSDTSFRFPEIEVGLVVTNGFTSLLPRTVGPARAKEIFFMGEPFDANAALALGLINRVVDPMELDSTVGEMAARLEKQPAHALRTAKQLVDFGLDRNLEATLASEVAATIAAELTPEAKSYAASFVATH